jgi:hypothetical protein
LHLAAPQAARQNFAATAAIGAVHLRTGGSTMTRTHLALALFSVTLALSFPAVATSPGTLTRTFVSAAGSDTNPCTVTQPCRTLVGAYAATAPSGIISALDPAGYGPLTITGPVTIDGRGWASVTATFSNAAAITINANPTDKVVLTGLTIDGGGTGFSGIAFNSGQSLTVEDCVVRGTTNDGLDFRGNATTTQTLTVANSRFYDTGRTGLTVVGFSSGAVNVAIDRSRFSGNASAGFDIDGSFSTGPLTVAVSDSVVANNVTRGVLVGSVAGHSAVNLSLTHTQIADSGTGIDANGPAVTVWLAQSTLTGNATLAYSAVNGAVIDSYGDNYLAAANGAAGAVLGTANKQ